MRKCNHCGKFKHEDEFSWRYRTLGIRQGACKKCKAEQDSNYYNSHSEDHKQTVKEQRAARRLEARQYVRDYLSSHSCVDCGESDPRFLEFDHVRGQKRSTVSQMVGQGYSIRAIQKEIKKCEIRCGHCHKIKTADERGWFR